MSRRLLLLVALLAGAAALAAVAVAGRGRTSASEADLRALEGVEFVTVCKFSHRAPDDPIVFPGKPERSHDHTFFGAVSADAFSTPRTLRDDATTCQRAEDTASYWAPTLLAGNRPVEPADAEFYYRRRTVTKLRPFPANLQVVAGNAAARTPQNRLVTFWNCGKHGGVAPSSRVPTCPNDGAKSLRLNVRFPDCWDGRRLDSRDHRAHMAYSLGGACPRTHPVAVPSLEIVIQYALAGGPAVQLSSRGQLSGHADFVNAWRQEGLKRLVDYCLNALRACGRAG
jgi:hypothetical protein